MAEDTRTARDKARSAVAKLQAMQPPDIFRKALLLLKDSQLGPEKDNTLKPQELAALTKTYSLLVALKSSLDYLENSFKPIE